MQVPEQDGGVSFKGQAVISASKWVPIESVSNKEALLRAACVTGYSRNIDLVIHLATVEKNHIRLPRHMTRLQSVPETGYTDITKNITWENVKFRKEITPRDKKQEDAWAAFEKADNGILSIACGGGKTVLGLKKVAQRGYPAVVLVSNGALMEQWADRAKTFLGMTDDEIGVVKAEKQQWDKPLVIAMLQTVTSRIDSIPMDVRMRFGTVVFDECHHMSARTFVSVADLFYGARFGLTATTDRSDGLEEVYYAHIGGVFYSDKSSEINAEVYFKYMPTRSVDDREITKRGELIISKLYDILATDNSRNKTIKADIKGALAAGRKVLVLSHSVAHVESLSSELARELPRKKVGMVHGGIKHDKRLPIIEESDVTVATFSLAKEGLDVPALDTLFLVTPFKDPGAFQQCRGRVERNYHTKKPPIVVVYEDVNITVSKALCASLKRSLKNEGRKFKTTKIK